MRIGRVVHLSSLFHEQDNYKEAVVGSEHLSYQAPFKHAQLNLHRKKKNLKEKPRKKYLK